MPDSSFVQCYRNLIGTMRLTPERSAKQLEEILRHISPQRLPMPEERDRPDRGIST